MCVQTNPTSMIEKVTNCLNKLRYLDLFKFLRSSDDPPKLSRKSAPFHLSYNFQHHHVNPSWEENSHDFLLTIITKDLIQSRFVRTLDKLLLEGIKKKSFPLFSFKKVIFRFICRGKKNCFKNRMKRQSFKNRRTRKMECRK